MKSENLPPHWALIESISYPGYSTEAAVADLIDNSISADAKNIYLEGEYDGQNSWISIRDDGSGMDKEGLRRAMQIPSMNPQDSRDPHDLGRFGLGLKTASLSHSRFFSVISSDGTEKNYLGWDKDFVKNTEGFNILTEPPKNSTAEKLFENKNKIKSGTIVIWEKMDKLSSAWNEDNDENRNEWIRIFSSIERHLGMVFHRFLKNKVKIFSTYSVIDRKPQQIKPWDPFLEKSSRQLNPEEEITSRAKVKAWILPHAKKRTPEEEILMSGKKGIAAHQGFYVYRNKRLVVDGNWLGLRSRDGKELQQEPHYSLARIQLDIDNEDDLEWGLDVKKEKIDPKAYLLNDLTRVARITREEAFKAATNRAKKSLQRGLRDSTNMWLSSKGKGPALKINRNHPFIKHLEKDHPDSKKKLTRILRTVEELLPWDYLIEITNNEPARLKEPFIESLNEFEKMIYEYCEEKLKIGVNINEVIEEIRPFELNTLHPEIMKKIEKDLRKNYEKK